MNKDVLYLASESVQRQRLLKEAAINFKTIKHNADECAVNLKKDFESYILDIAKEKMKYVQYPKVEEGQIIFVLTADTMVYTNKTGTILGKPQDMEDAKRMLRLFRSEEGKIVTGCCLDKKVFKNGIWQNEAENHWTTTSLAEFVVDEEEFDEYFKHLPHSLKSASGGIIEEYGQRFCKSITGSYSNIIGLPIFELIQALKQMEFKF
jgi:septum formation protein